MTKISIITITYNAQNVILRTLQSIENQTCKDFEYIIIDGASSDDTLKIINQYEHLITKQVSEPDKGIYDAMNKGLKLASGDFVWFMNAGDEIAEPNTVCLLNETINKEIDLIYGDSLFVNENGEPRGLRSKLTPHRLRSSLKWTDLKYGMMVCHQSLLVRRTIATNYMENNLSADVDWEINAFKNSRMAVFINQPLSKYLEGGISNQNLKRSLIDRYLVLQKHFGLLPNLWNHLIILFRGLFKIASNKGKYW
ncbi:glycosyltransferase family 2 protein [Jiulongibacter sp. NS-SX5]|uniref:glycosyltransferase family 2 protein n=1 Tax=Jiulongibacter sp. NS-SX5 TaxID=3463854 RepID=UPI00405A03E0